MVGHARRALAVAAGCGLIAAVGTGCGNGASGGSQDGDTVTIGAILSLSGAYSTLGPPEKTSIQMGIDAVNEAGGVTVDGKKYKFAVKVIDDKSDAGTAGVAAYRQLAVVDKVPALAMGLGTSNYQSVIKRNPLPVLNILDSTYPGILKYSDHVFLVRTATPGYAPGCPWYAKNVLKADRMAFIGAGADTYSAGLETWVKKSAASYGVKITANANYPAGTTDFSPFIQKAMKSKPEAIYLGGVTSEILPVLKQLRQNGIKLPVFHSSGVTPDQAQEILGGSVYNDMMKDNYDCAGTLPSTSTQATTRAFADDYQQKTSAVPQDLTMWAYDYPWILKGAMEKAGTVTDSAKIYKALHNMPVPSQTISGWVAQDGNLFKDRNAITASQIMAWCPDKKTIKPTLTYRMDDLNVTDRDLVVRPCEG